MVFIHVKQSKWIQVDHMSKRQFLDVYLKDIKSQAKRKLVEIGVIIPAEWWILGSFIIFLMICGS